MPDCRECEFGGIDRDDGKLYCDERNGNLVSIPIDKIEKGCSTFKKAEKSKKGKLTKEDFAKAKENILTQGFKVPGFLVPAFLKEEPAEYILCAAIHYKLEGLFTHQPKNIEKGIVVCGRRHNNCIITKSLMLIPRSTKTTQGFLTNNDRFVDRAEAGEIAFAANQIEEPTVCLFSEDLY